MIKSTFKGAIIGLLVGSSFTAIGRNSTLYWKKMRIFANSSRLNEAKMIWSVNKNFVLLGAAMYSSNFFMWYTFHGEKVFI